MSLLSWHKTIQKELMVRFHWRTWNYFYFFKERFFTQENELASSSKKLEGAELRSYRRTLERTKNTSNNVTFRLSVRKRGSLKMETTESSCLRPMLSSCCNKSSRSHASRGQNLLYFMKCPDILYCPPSCFQNQLQQNSIYEKL